MRIEAACLASLLICTPACAAPAFQIVESVPQGTSFGARDTLRTQPVWMSMIEGARKSIDIAAFYITDHPGSTLTPVLSAIAGRARAGVHVRVLLDQTFMRETKDNLALLKDVPNLELAILPMRDLTGGVLHAKYMIVDHARVFVGSQNWDWRALEQIHEVGAVIDDAKFGETFTAAFDFDWSAARHPDRDHLAAARKAPLGFAPVTADHPVEVAAAGGPASLYPAFSPPPLTPAGLSDEQTGLVGLISHARSMFRLQVMTLSALKGFGAKGWWPEIDSAIRDAAARGVQVRIIVADWALHEPMQAYLKSLALMPGITVKFSTVPPDPAGFIPYARVEHAKYAVADETDAVIGTGNWEWSYFANTVDASVFVHGSGPAQTLARIFDADWNGAYVTTIDPAGHYAAPKVSK